MTRIIFIAATGTDIGKTYVTVMLVKQLQDQGHRVRAIKPVISGFDRDDMANSDSGRLLKAMGQDVTRENITAISPWRYTPALPPHLAAEQAGKPIDLDNLTAFCQKETEQELDFLLIEGVGGIMTPLNYHQTMIDLVGRLEGHCLLVTASSLGTLSHTLTAIDCIRQRKIILDGLVISESVQSYADFETVTSDFEKIIPDIPLRYIPRNTPSSKICSLVI